MFPNNFIIYAKYYIRAVVEQNLYMYNDIIV